ncbi:MAG: hypothetical protein PHX21_04140 [bacterium]|nr:hypothetical protein [bacterium]
MKNDDSPVLVIYPSVCRGRNYLQPLLAILILISVFFCVTPSVNAQLFSITQLIDRKCVKSELYDSLKQCELIRNPQRSMDDKFYELKVPTPKSLFNPDSFINKGDFVAVFKNSSLKSIDRVSGFWWRYLGTNDDIVLYVGLKKNGLKDTRDTWGADCTNLYVIAPKRDMLKRFKGVTLKETIPLKSDSILSFAIEFLYKHPELIQDNIWYGVKDTLISSNQIRNKIKEDCSVTVLSCDFTADGKEDFILKVKDEYSFGYHTFTMIFESGGMSPQFIKWSKFEQVIRDTSRYLLLLRGGQPETGMHGWTIYEGKGDGNLKDIFGEYSYSD